MRTLFGYNSKGDNCIKINKVEIRMKYILLILVTVFALSGCNTTHPIYNADATASKSVSSNEMKRAIIDALIYKRWNIVSDDGNTIVADINVRQHYAEIKIDYTADSFKINYLSSKNLDYDGEKQGIHRNYNKWIQLLERQIQGNVIKTNL